MGELETTVQDLVRVLPLLALAVLVFMALSLLGWLLSRWDGLWRVLTPNRFVAELVGSTVFGLFVVFGLVSALNLLDATAFLGALLGAADFPSPSSRLCSAECLFALRLLGMQTTLGRTAVLRAARSLQQRAGSR